MSAGDHLNPGQFFHASSHPTWEPRAGTTHVGTQEAALDRAFETHRPYVHEFEFKGPVHPDLHDDDAVNVADPRTSDFVRDTYRKNLRARVGDHADSMIHHATTALNQGHALAYMNRQEGKGSTSLVVPDASQLVYKKTHYLPGVARPSVTGEP